MLFTCTRELVDCWLVEDVFCIPEGIQVVQVLSSLAF